MSKVIVISGTSRGIGRELKNYYLSRGNIVVGLSRSSVDDDNSNYYHYSLDISDEQPVCMAVKEVGLKFGKIDVLINNAGQASMNSFVLTPYETALRIMKTNFFGTFLLTREVSKFMIRQKWGRIVNISSIAVKNSIEGESVYASSKAAVETLTKVVAKELAPYNVTVNAVAPPPIDTDLVRAVPKEKIDRIIMGQAIKKKCNFSDVINVIDFFIYEGSSFVTGQVVYLGDVA